MFYSMVEEDNSTGRYLDLNDTNVLKGIALILLLVHHLFSPSMYDNYGWDELMINGHLYPVTLAIGGLSNVCVALFVLLSGYGLTRQRILKKCPPQLLSFYKHRLGKLMFNYWFIFVIFVSLDIFVFDRNINDAYDGNHVVAKFIADVFGLTHFFDFLAINPTWWFMSLIIFLYLIFPFLYRLVNNDPLFFVLMFSLVALIPWTFDPLTMLSLIFAFCLGIILARKPINFKIRYVFFYILLLGIGVFLRRRNYSTFNYYDGLISVGIVYIYMILTLPKVVNKILAFIGRHSMNIFLFHTFLFYYWFSDFVYSFRNPILILVFFSALCLLVSLALEKIKKLIRFEKLVKLVG